MTTDDPTEAGPGLLRRMFRIAVASAMALFAGTLTLPIGVIGGGGTLLCGGATLWLVYSALGNPGTDAATMNLMFAAVSGALTLGSLLMLAVPVATVLLGLLGVGLTATRWYRPAIAVLVLALAGGGGCALFGLAMLLMSVFGATLS